MNCALCNYFIWIVYSICICECACLNWISKFVLNLLIIIAWSYHVNDMHVTKGVGFNVLQFRWIFHISKAKKIYLWFALLHFKHTYIMISNIHYSSYFMNLNDSFINVIIIFINHTTSTRSIILQPSHLKLEIAGIFIACLTGAHPLIQTEAMAQ